MAQCALSPKKVLVIGLDGATFYLLLPLLQKGELPFFSNFLKDGVYTTLQSTIPMFTPTAWSSFMTGKNPGKHGVIGFFARESNSYNTITSTSRRRGEDIWTILSKNGKKVVVINVPFTYPPKEVNGCMISGSETKSEDFVYPSSLKREIESIVGKYPLHSTYAYREGKEDIFISEIFQLTEIRAKTALYLMNRFVWNFFIVVFEGTDNLQHALWKYLDPSHILHNPEKSEKYRKAFLSYLKRIDQISSELAYNAGENATVIIMSDHGFGPLYKYININTWLSKLGLLKLRRRLRTRIKYLLYLAGITPFGTLNLLSKLYKGNIRIRGGSRERYSRLLRRLFLSFLDVDWKKTKAFSWGSMGQISINLKGREPMGMVNPGEEYEQLRNQLIKDLYKLKDSNTNICVIEKVFKKEEIYNGPLVNTIPDLVCIPRQGYIYLEELDFPSNSITIPPKWLSGTHRPEGIFMMKGPQIKRGVQVENIVKIEDLAPTILYLLETTIPSDMDGKVIVEAFKESTKPS